MHQVINAIIYANSGKDAIEHATEIFNQLTVNEEPYDYYNLFNSSYATSRWGQRATCSNVANGRGLGIVNKAWKLTEKEIKYNLDIVRKHLELYDNQDFIDGSYELPEGAEWSAHMVLHFMYSASKYTGSTYFLYDNDGEAIRNRHHLDNVLDKWSCLYKDKPNPYQDKKIWVIPADVHY